ncbi:SMI1/KNR4 family protein [Streptomyces sp. NPDC047082]|uniref:SMI1/KNR4 family protein n=1 Tax=Streptomyces sp. NPDC047082 TaxID=3155259 RepID=UPI0033F9B009
MNTEQADPAELEALRAAFDVDDGGESALGWDKVHAFEARHGIVLPEPYRSLVAEVTDGSYAGPPHDGLLGLGELPDDWGGKAEERDLSLPFPLVEEWLWEGTEAERVDSALGPVFNHGSLVLGTDGCGMYWHLVVTGPHRGRIWNITDVGAAPFGAEFGHTTASGGFAGWVAHWAAGKPWFDKEVAAR